MEFRNNSGLKFSDISSEALRTYDFGDGKQVTVKDPLFLNVSTSGGHRIFDAAGASHYVPVGWIHLKWVVKEGAPHFDF